LSHKERRRAERFTFGMPLIVHWKSGSEQWTAQTITEDVSSRGVYFYLPEAIPTGTAVEVEMTMPTQITLSSPVRVRCHGRIQRCVINPGESAGMAMMIEKYEFLCESKDAA
jgi:PilZ domain